MNYHESLKLLTYTCITLNKYTGFSDWRWLNQWGDWVYIGKNFHLNQGLRNFIFATTSRQALHMCPIVSCQVNNRQGSRASSLSSKLQYVMSFTSTLPPLSRGCVLSWRHLREGRKIVNWWVVFCVFCIWFVAMAVLPIFLFPHYFVSIISSFQLSTVISL